MKRITLPLFVLGLAAACVDATSPASVHRLAPLIEPSGDLLTRNLPGEYIVVLNDSVRNVSDAVDEVNVVVTHQWQSAIKGYAIRAGAQGLLEVRRSARVKYVEPNGVVNLSATQTPTPSWGIDRIDQSALPLNNNYSYPNQASGVHAYILDTGIRQTHTEFAGRMSTQRFDAITPGGTAADCHGHGTHVAGTVGGTTYGVAKGVTLHAVRVLNCQGSGTWAQIISGLDWVAQNRVMPAVANMSLGGGASASIDNAVATLVSQGVFVAVAAGNDNADACNYSPARAPTAATIGSTTSSDGRSSFSNYGTCVDLFAPGSGIVSAYYTSDNATATSSGTSMASPHVAGAGAIYLGANPSASPAQVVSALVGGAVSGAIGNVGAGSPNRLLNVAFIGTPPPPPPPTNQAPVANFTITCLPAQCFMDATSSTDDGGFANLTLAWTNNEGRYGRTGPKIDYRWTPGFAPSFELTLTVTDAQGLSHSVTKTIAFSGAAPPPPPPPPPPPTNQPPVANFTISCIPAQCFMDATSSTDDGGFSNLTIAWSNNEGRYGRIGPKIDYRWTPGFAPSFELTLTVTDAQGLSNSITKTILFP